MSGWLSAMLVMAVAARYVTVELDVFQLLEMRSLIGIVLLIPLIRASGGLKAMKTQRPLQHMARNVVQYAAQYGWFVAMTMIPLAQVVAIEFTMPIWTALLAVSVLGERMTAWKTFAVLLGLIGVAIIVRPTTGEVNPGQLVALGAAIGFSIALIIAKSLTRSDGVVTIIFWMLVVQSVIGLIPALYVWRWPSAHIWPWIFVIAVCGTFSHYCITRAMLHADATLLGPMDFLRVPLTAGAGWLLFAERIDAYTVIGAALILVANLLNLRSPPPAPVRA
jgi:drug/metabolite transporter (DMT)-like permease